MLIFTVAVHPEVDCGIFQVDLVDDYEDLVYKSYSCKNRQIFTISNNILFFFCSTQCICLQIKSQIVIAVEIFIPNAWFYKTNLTTCSFENPCRAQSIPKRRLMLIFRLHKIWKQWRRLIVCYKYYNSAKSLSNNNKKYKKNRLSLVSVIYIIHVMLVDCFFKF